MALHEKRGPFSLVREWPPFDPPRERKGHCPLTPTLADCSLKSCTRCAIGCGVHGFAMNPYVSLRLATAPYYREARVTAERRQTACGIRCGVHGFAMNPYYSLPLATAPYYRGARVTLARRQTACRMRHCCARRIVETGGRRKLVCTSTRWAERQRVVEVTQIV